MAHTTTLFLAILVASRVTARSVACDDLVECANGTHAPTQRRCPGHPEECSGHGRCHFSANAEPSCKCAEGFFGRDCGRRQRDCTKLRSCADCQHPANTKFCGWCADSRYCVPKHIHKGLAKKGKACGKWYEDTCPRNASATTHGFDALGYSLAEEWGDDNSVALAEALVAFIDGAAGEGTSSTLSTLGMISMVGLVTLCAVRERRAAERRRRFEAFMAEEAESLHSAGPVAPSPWGLASPDCRRLGPAWIEQEDSGMRRSVLAEALGTSAPLPKSTAPLPGGAAPAQPLAALPLAPPPPAPVPVGDVGAPEDDEALRRSVRDAARRDIEERKERRRVAAEEARLEAERTEREAAEQSARAELQAKAQGLRTGTPVSPPPAAQVTPATQAPPAGQATPATPLTADPMQTRPVVASAQTSAVTPATAPAFVQPPPPAAAPAPAQPQAPVSSVAAATPGGVAPLPAAAVSDRPAPASATTSELARAEAEFLDALDDL